MTKQTVSNAGTYISEKSKIAKDNISDQIENNDNLKQGKEKIVSSLGWFASAMKSSVQSASN